MSKHPPKQKSRSGRRSRSAAQKPVLTAKSADRHLLYQKSVQDPPTEIELIDKAFHGLRGRHALTVREDFCGTALFCAAWIKSRKKRTAVGVDLDPNVMKWGEDRHLANLDEPGDRIELLVQDVREASERRFDAVVAYNFSYWVFKTRELLLDYFVAVYDALEADGVFFLDAYGGTEAGEVIEEKRKIAGGFTYVWHQAEWNPIDHHCVNHIHFEFKDKTRMEKAFTYDWRFWTLPEIQELLLEAGFRDVEVYWDVSDDDSVSDYRPRRVVENQAGWVAYITAAK